MIPLSTRRNGFGAASPVTIHASVLTVTALNALSTQPRSSATSQKPSTCLLSDSTIQDPHSAVELVDSNHRLAEVVQSAARLTRVAFDLEANGFHRYPERICLIQLALPGASYLIDPLAISDPGPLGKLLADPGVEIILHSGDYDVRSLDREWGFRINALFDTSIAAAFLGASRLGLATVLQEYLGIDLDKSKRLQRADWTIRPLTLELREYAAADVAHLVRVRDLFADELSKLSRLEWVAEECLRLSKVTFNPPDPQWAFASIKGSRDLDGQGLAVLYSLHQFRIQEAIRSDRPPFKVLPDGLLLSLAANPNSELSTTRGLGRFSYPPGVHRLRAALRAGIDTPPLKRPRPQSNNSERLGPEERRTVDQRLRHLKAWRTGMGDRLGLDAALIWPAVSLQRLARYPDRLDEEFASSEVRSWQRREAGDSIRAFLATLSSNVPD